MVVDLILTLVSINNNPLEFWKLYENSLPHLSEMASKYLCVQSSSVPSERVFSTAGDTVTAERSRLDPTKVDMVIFLKKKCLRVLITCLLDNH